MINFIVERMDLNDPANALGWAEIALPHDVGEVQGAEADAVLASVVARDGGVEVGVAACFADGQAVTVARNGEVVYALRAIPRALL
jgi:hypothetical protein